MKAILEKKDLRLLADSCILLDKLISIEPSSKAFAKDKASIEKEQFKMNNDQKERVM